MPRTKPNDVRRRRRLQVIRLDARQRLRAAKGQAAHAPTAAAGQESTPPQPS